MIVFNDPNECTYMFFIFTKYVNLHIQTIVSELQRVLIMNYLNILKFKLPITVEPL